MSAAIPLRDDCDGSGLRGSAKGSRDPVQLRRLLALAEIHDGGSRSDAARDWVLRFNAGGPEALIDPETVGRKPKLNDAQRQALAEIVEDGPLPALHGVVVWRLKDLKQWVRAEFGIAISVQSLSRELRALN